MDEHIKTPNKWYIVMAKAISHKQSSLILEKLGCTFYLPIQKQLHYWSDRKKWVDVPVLSPYIFLYTNELDRKIIFQTTNNFHFLRYENGLATAKPDEVETVKLICTYSTNLKIESQPLKKGDLIEITHGPLSGMKGHVLQENGNLRFHIQVPSLGQFASVDIDKSWLKVS